MKLIINKFMHPKCGHFVIHYCKFVTIKIGHPYHYVEYWAA